MVRGTSGLLQKNKNKVITYASLEGWLYLRSGRVIYHLLLKYSKGMEIFEEDAQISTDTSEAADYPDGTIRYEASLENESENRLNKVLTTNGACTYEDSDNIE